MSRWFWLHAGLFALALVLRLGLTAATVGIASPPDIAAAPDQADYEQLAFNLSTGEGYALTPGTPTACRSPGTAFVLAPIYALFGRNYLIARLWFCLLSAACVPIVGATGHRLLGPLGGVVAAMWLAFYPGHAYYALHFVSESPATLLTAIALLVQLAVLRRAPSWRDLALGLVLGLAALVRPSLAIMTAVSCAVALIARGASVPQRLVKTGLTGSAATAVVIAWCLRNQAVMGKFGVATLVGGCTFWGANNKVVYDSPASIGYWTPVESLIDQEHPMVGSEVDREAAAWKYGREYRQAHAEQLPLVTMHRVGRVVLAYHETTNEIVDFGFRWGWLLSLPFVAVGVVAISRRMPAEGLLLLGPFVAVLFTAVSFYGCSRFRDAAAPAAAVFFAAGVCAVIGQLGQSRGDADSRNAA